MQMAGRFVTSGARGFTLIEVMMVMVIIGILAAITLPAYQGSVSKARRADARSALVELATRQEKFFAQNSTYSTSVSPVGTGLGLGRTTSAEGYYNLTATTCTGGAISRCYLLSAAATGAQADDIICATFTLDNVGRKVAKTSTSATSPNCW
jgi:type IV pilus assembly protein PilE